jgi:hypothetical protein
LFLRFPVIVWAGFDTTDGRLAEHPNFPESPGEAGMEIPGIKVKHERRGINPAGLGSLPYGPSESPGGKFKEPIGIEWLWVKFNHPTI